jgi:hypothetical protein
LQRFLVGVSHECDLAPEKADLEALFDRKMCRRVTTSEINPHYMSQKEVCFYSFVDSLFVIEMISGSRACFGVATQGGLIVWN